ncbi:MAG TPA: tetratricopeptide repeat protein, partial [Steroidobacteraceae bacterium]|nr:tetratricopeptide repeat protein [Steroidobacteraceae bacterium]
KSVGKDVDGSAVLESAAKSIEYELTDQPAARARLLHAVGVAHSRRGEWRLSIGYLSDAVRLLKLVPGAEAEVLRGMAGLSAALSKSGELHEAHRALTGAPDLAQRSGLLQSPTYAELLLARGRIYLQESRVSEAQADFEEGLRIYKEKLGAKSLGVAEALADLTQIFLWTDDFAKAERTAREAIAVFDMTVPPMYPDRVSAEENLAEALYLQNKLDEAGSLLANAVRQKTEVFGRNSMEVADALDRFAVVRHSQRRFREAEELSREAIAICRLVLGDKHTSMANISTTLGRALVERGKYSEAEATLREALDIYLTTLPAGHQYTASTEYLLGELLLTTDRLSEAEALLTASMNRWKRSGAPPWRAMRSASAVGEALYRQGRVEEAQEYLAASFAALTADPKADPEAKYKARRRAERYLQKSATPPQRVPSAGS